MRGMLIVTAIVLLAAAGQANDSAVEVAVGGLKLRKEHAVLMEKERLIISENLVRVEYEFRNTSKKPVTSEVAFPIPPFEFSVFGIVPNFEDVKVWVDGEAIQTKKEIRAFVGGKEITNELRQLGLEIESFGGEGINSYCRLDDLSEATRRRLIQIKAYQLSDNTGICWPKWSVEVKYHWRQTFSPGVVVRITHEYRPMIGYRQIKLQEIKNEIDDSCWNTEVFPEVRQRVSKSMQQDPSENNHIFASWVSYILTTANTWQTPIKDFELIIRPKEGKVTAFCWDGPIAKTRDGHYRVHKKDFIPRADLKVYYLGL